MKRSVAREGVTAVSKDRILVKNLATARRLRWAGHVAHAGEISGAYRPCVGKPEGRRPPRRRWEDNIKIDL